MMGERKRLLGPQQAVIDGEVELERVALHSGGDDVLCGNQAGGQFFFSLVVAATTASWSGRNQRNSGRRGQGSSIDKPKRQNGGRTLSLNAKYLVSQFQGDGT